MVVARLVQHLYGLAVVHTKPLLSPRAKYWIRVLGRFVSVQLLIQLTGAVAGIFLVRKLEPTQYAYFAIANSMQSTMNTLADTGIGSGLSAIGGKVWQDRYRLGQLVSTVISLRRNLALLALTIITPILVGLLINNGASRILAGTITAVILIEFNFRLTIGIFHSVLRLRSQINRIQALELIFAISRLALLGLAYLTYFNAITAIVASVLSSGFQRILIGRWIVDEIDRAAPPRSDDRVEVIDFVKSQATYSIFFCIQGQLTIWLITIFGSTQQIAEVSALGRLGMLLAVIASVVNYIVAPAFSRSRTTERLQRLYFQTIITFSLIAIVVVSFAWLYPNALLWIIGNKYAHLKTEVVLVIISTMIGSLGNTIASLNMSKGWVKQTWMIVPLTVITQVIALTTLDVSSVKGVVVFGMLSSLPTIGINAYLSYKGLTNQYS